MEIRIGDHAPEPAAAWIAERLRSGVRRRGVASVALSGGGTAAALVAALAAADVPWASVGVWQVDERVVPDGHPARNAGLLAPLLELPCRVRLMPVTATDLRRAARRYAAGLPGRFDVVHLGVGEDGHTASWPPGDVATRESARAVELVGSFHGVPRMTLTRRIVDEARARVVLAVGPAKRPAITGWLRGDPDLPIAAVRPNATWVFLDAAAAPEGGLH